MSILTLQSHVAFGHVGNSAAVFPLQRLGYEVWAAPTVVLSNHTGYPDAGGGALDPALLRDILDGLERRDIWPACRGILTGYIPSAAVGELAAATVARVKAAAPDALFLCDPVMGDETQGAYIPPAARAVLIARLAPLADLLTPNVFELGLLTGRTLAPDDAPAIAAAARTLLAEHGDLRGVVATGVWHGDRQGCLTAERSGAAHLLLTPTVVFPGPDKPPNGTGDLLAALILGHILARPTAGLAAAVTAALASVHGVLARTARAEDRREMALIAAQDAIAAPDRTVVARLAI